MESPYYEMTHDFEEENRLFQSGYVKGYHDAVMKCPDIVRCKDCQYAASDMACSHESEWGNEISRNRYNPNWFCADGERSQVTVK